MGFDLWYISEFYDQFYVFNLINWTRNCSSVFNINDVSSILLDFRTSVSVGECQVRSSKTISCFWSFNRVRGSTSNCIGTTKSRKISALITSFNVLIGTLIEFQNLSAWIPRYNLAFGICSCLSYNFINVEWCNCCRWKLNCYKRVICWWCCKTLD